MSLNAYIMLINDKFFPLQLAQFARDFSTRGGVASPWDSGTPAAPFDQEFYIIMNVAVGGINFFPDKFTDPATGAVTYPGNGGKPWSNKSPHAANEFWSARDSWLPTWCTEEEPERCAMKIDSVRAWTFEKKK